MIEFYGSVSFTGRVHFSIKALDKDHAKKIVFEDIDSLEFTLNDNTNLEIEDVEWELIEKQKSGWVSESYIDDFEIYLLCGEESKNDRENLWETT